MDNITKLNETTAQVQTTVVQTETITLDHLNDELAAVQGDIKNAIDAHNTQLEYLQSQVDGITAQIQKLRDLGIVTQVEFDATNITP